MKKKIAAILLISLILGTVGAVSQKQELAYAIETRAEEVIVSDKYIWEPKVNTPWTEPKWEPFSNKYGVFPNTYAFSDGDFEGTLNAMEIKVSPIESSKRVVWESAPADDKSVERKSEYRGGPPTSSFPVTVESKTTNPVTNQVVTGQIAKNGTPVRLDIESPEPYHSWGGWTNTGGFYFRFLGNGSSTWQASGQTSFSFNAPKPLQEYAPYWRFYGDLSVIEDTSFKLVNNKNYLDTRSGTQKYGMEWADSKQWTGNELRPKTFNKPSSDIWGGVAGADLLDIHGNKVFKKNSSGNWGIVSRGFDIYTTKAQTELKSNPEAGSPTIATIPKDTPFQVTMGKGGYYYISYYKSEDIAWNNGKASVKPGSFGTGGWVLSNVAEFNLGLTGIPQGGNVNTNRKGAQLQYELINYTSKYTQKYSGDISFQNTYYDKWKVEVKYKGTVEDIRLNNFKVKNLSVTPAFTNVFPGKSSGTGNIKVNFTVSHEFHKNPGVASYSSYTEIYMGSTRIWKGNITVPTGGSTKQSITVNSLAVPAGNNTITVETNKDRKHLERNPAVADPYADNKASTTHLGYRLKLNNIKVDSVTVNPTRTEISPGDNSSKNNLTVAYTVSHEMDSTPGSTPLSVPVEIKIGNKVLWSGNENIPQNGKFSNTRTFTNVTVPRGVNTISVEANKAVSGVRVHTELVPGVSNPYGDNVRNTTHAGVEPDTNDFVVTQVKAAPYNVQLNAGDVYAKQALTVNFTIEHRLSAIPGNALLSPLVVIKLGGTKIWQGTVGVMPGGSSNRSITIEGLNIPAGNHALQVEVNADRFLSEKLPNNQDAYANNRRTITYRGIRHTVCELEHPTESRTKNVWSERWTKNIYGGALEGSGSNSIYRVSNISTVTTDMTYRETYKITEIYFRSKFTRDMHKAGYPGFNALGHVPGREEGWVKVEEGSTMKIKGGYGFEVIAMTNYETNRNLRVYTALTGSPYSGPNGPGQYRLETVTPSITPISTPDILYINMYESNGIPLLCEVMTKPEAEQKSSDWFQKEELFQLPEVATINGIIERKVYTNVGANAGVYKVSISTPRPDRPNAFRGYEAEAPVVMANKGFLHDSINFNLEILGQDDLKSHITQ